jgi:hypothetical protein
VSVARHTTYNLLGALAPVLITIAVTPFYITAVGVERYGVLAIFWTLLSSLSFMSFGMAPALARQLAGMSDATPQERSDLVWTGLLLSLPGALMSGLLVVIIGTFYFQYFAQTHSVLEREIRLALPWFAASVPASMIGYVLAGALQGRSQFGVMNVLQVGTLALTSIVPLTIALTVGHGRRQLCGPCDAIRDLPENHSTASAGASKIQNHTTAYHLWPMGDGDVLDRPGGHVGRSFFHRIDQRPGCGNCLCPAL